MSSKSVKVVKLKSPGAWVYEQHDCVLTIYSDRNKELDIKTVNFVLDMAKQALLK